MAALPIGTQAFKVYAQYDQAVKERQFYEALRQQHTDPRDRSFGLEVL